MYDSDLGVYVLQDMDNKSLLKKTILEHSTDGCYKGQWKRSKLEYLRIENNDIHPME